MCQRAGGTDSPGSFRTDGCTEWGHLLIKSQLFQNIFFSPSIEVFSLTPPLRAPPHPRHGPKQTFDSFCQLQIKYLIILKGRHMRKWMGWQNPVKTIGKSLSLYCSLSLQCLLTSCCKVSYSPSWKCVLIGPSLACCLRGKNSTVFWLILYLFLFFPYFLLPTLLPKTEFCLGRTELTSVLLLSY